MRECCGLSSRHSLTETSFICWLLELAKDCPSTWQLQGSDISALQYPAVEYLPKNVSLETFDAFREVPNELVGKYNVVHCRFLCCVIKRNDVEPLLRNAIKMLSMFHVLYSKTIQVKSTG